jgi:hypothetical protein
MIMKTRTRYIGIALLLATKGLPAEPGPQPDPERLQRIQQRFGQLQNAETSTPADLPRLPIEEERPGFSLFGSDSDAELETGGAMTGPAGLRRPRPQRRAAAEPKKNWLVPAAGENPEESDAESGWGWLHDQVRREQRQAEQEQLAQQEELRRRESLELEEGNIFNPNLSEEDIQAMVNARINKQYEMGSPNLILPGDPEQAEEDLSPFARSSRILKSMTDPLKESRTPVWQRTALEEPAQAEMQTEPRNALFDHSPFAEPLENSPLLKTPGIASERNRIIETRNPPERTPLNRPSMKWKDYLDPEKNTVSVQRRTPQPEPTDRFKQLRKMPDLQEDIDNLRSEDAFPKVRTSVWE